MTLLDEDQAFLLGKRKPSKFVVRNWFQIPPTIMLAQISVCIFAWTFAGFRMHRTITPPYNMVIWILKNPSDTQVIVTLLSTILALTGSS